MIAKGVLIQTLRPWKWPVAYLSKKLNPEATGQPSYIHIIVTVAFLVKDADKQTLGQNLTIATPHALEGVLKQPPNCWLSNAHMTLLLNPARIIFQVPMALNLATLLPNPDLEAPLHECTGILAQAHCI